MGPEPDPRRSVLGLVSVALGVLAGLLWLGLQAGFKAGILPTGLHGLGFVGYLFGVVAISGLGAVAGLVGVFQKDRRRILPLAGILLNAALIAYLLTQPGVFRP